MFTESKTDPRVAKTVKDCCFLVEQKEVRRELHKSSQAFSIDLTLQHAAAVRTGSKGHFGALHRTCF